MNIVKYIATSKYEIEMHNDLIDGYMVTTTVYGLKQPITIVKTKDFEYASNLFDTMVASIRTVYDGGKV